MKKKIIFRKWQQNYASSSRILLLFFRIRIKMVFIIVDSSLKLSLNCTMSYVQYLVSKFNSLDETDKNEFFSSIEKPETLYVDTILSYNSLTKTHQKQFLKSILFEIFQKQWNKSFCDPASVLNENFEDEFNHHFHDPFSQALISLAEDAKKHQIKRSRYLRRGLIHIDKAWRLTNTHAETLSYDTMRCILATSNQATSCLTSSTTIAKSIDILKSIPFPSPDPKLAIVRAIDNYEKFKKSLHTLNIMKLWARLVGTRLTVTFLRLFKFVRHESNENRGDVTFFD